MSKARLPLVLLGLLTLLVASRATAGPDEADEAARAYARTQLFAAARRVAGDGSIRQKGLDALRRGLSEDILYLTAAPDDTEEARALLERLQLTIEARILLLGQPADDDGVVAGGKEEQAPARGAAEEATTLFRWLQGKEPCAITVSTLRGDAVIKEEAYSYDPAPPAPKAPAPAATDGASESKPQPALAEGAKPTETEGKPQREKAEADSGAGTSGSESQAGEKPAVDAAGGEGAAPAVPSPAAPPRVLSLTEWARDVVQAREGTLRGKRIQPQSCSTVSDLVLLSREPVRYLEIGRPLRRHALATALPFAYNLPFIRVRDLQAIETSAAMATEKPTLGLVDESTIREMARRASLLRERVDKVEEERRGVLAAIDLMTLDIDDWRDQAAILSGQIQEERRRLEESLAPEEREAGTKPEASLRLRMLEAQEATLSLDLRLFYQTVLRAEYRLDLLKELFDIAGREARAAEVARDEFTRALDQVRNERQLDRLRSQARIWARALEGERKAASSPEARVAGPASERATAYESALAVNTVVRDAVERRRQASVPTHSAGPSAAARPSAGATPAAAPAAGSPTPSPADAADKLLAENDPRRKLSSLAADPSLHPWSLADVQVLATELKDDSLRLAYDPALIAEHYRAATAQILALGRALQTTRGDEELRSRFDEAFAKAEASLAPLQARGSYLGRERLPQALQTLKVDFDETLAGLAERRTRFQEALDAIRAYRASLLDLGTLSLAVRTNHDLDLEQLVQASRDVLVGLQDAGRFVVPQSESGGVTFLREHWLGALAVVALLVGVVAAVRWLLRRRLDRWLERKAYATPGLRWTGASVRQERARAEERKRRELEAARAVAEEAKRQATAPAERSEAERGAEGSPSGEKPGPRIDREIDTDADTGAGAEAGRKPPGAAAPPSAAPIPASAEPEPSEKVGPR